MIRLTFPEREHARDAVMQTANNTVALSSQRTLDELQEKARQIEQACLQNPEVDFAGDVREIIRQSYQITLDLFDLKEQQGIALLPEELAIRSLCQEELTKPQQLNGILSYVFHAVSRTRDVIQEIKTWFGLESASDRASRILAEAGNQLLPGYATLVQGFFTSIDAFFSPDFIPTVVETAVGQAEAALLYQVKNKTVDKRQAAQMLNFASLAYDGYDARLSGDYVSLEKSELPSSIQVLYEEATGLIKASWGLQAWLGKKDNEIVVAYCGTIVSNPSMVYADIEQLSAPSLLYLKAAGLLKLICAQFSGKHMQVAGHSLGGGLTQFAMTANLTQDNCNIDGWSYNPAGLSQVSLNYLNADRLNRAKDKSCVFMTAYDPVSTFGAKLGYLVTLPKSRHNGHGRSDLQECMALYVGNTRNTAVQTATPITLTAMNYSESGLIPYTSQISLCSADKALWWPCMNENYQTGQVRNTFLQVSVSKELLSLLQEPGDTLDCCAGVYNGFNGTGQTAANRLLLAAGKDITGAAGGMYSIMVFGAFGMGKQQFFELMQQAYVESGMIYSASRDVYESILSHIRNPYPKELDAWYHVLNYVVDLTSILQRYPEAQVELEKVFIAFSNDREDLFQSLYHNRPPLKAETRTLLKALKALAHRHMDGVLSQAVSSGILSHTQRDMVLSQMETFCDTILTRAG